MNILSFIPLYQSSYDKIAVKSKRNNFYIIPKLFLRFFLRVLKSIFSRSSAFFKLNDTLNEDMVWARLFYKKGNVPPAIEAMKFSFELFPEYLYKINNYELPFGCHAWFINRNYPFYKKHIKVNL